MNKKFTKILTGAVSCALVLSFAGMSTGCKKDDDEKKTYNFDPEQRPFTIAISEPDGNFNPFFYTSLNDGEIIGLTQIGMLATDENGSIICGEDQPTVVKSYTMNQTANDTTTYKFLIKNGIKFSDGTSLTIRDVLFNMYVYLDVQYSGSTTMYSVDIQGLNAYRAQDPNLGDEGGVDFTAQFYATAQGRIDDMILYDDNKLDTSDEDTYKQLLNDIAAVNKFFRKELTTAWTSNAGQLSSYTDEFNFTEDWESYFYSIGFIGKKTLQTPNGIEYKYDENGKFITDLDEDPEYRDNMRKYMSDADLIAKYKKDYNCTDEQAVEYIMRDKAIDYVYYSYFDEKSSEVINPDAPEAEQKKADMPLPGKKLTEILKYWNTRIEVLEDFANEAKSDHYTQLTKDGLLVRSISGITTSKTSTFNGQALSEPHDVLQVVINGTDPAAIFNFAFTVAPMSYYSGVGDDGIDYVDRAMGSDLDNNPLTGVSNRFGVRFGNKNFFDSVLNDSDKTRCPVGAGAYKVSNSNGGDGTASSFYVNNVAYYQRNTNFETVGEQISNAKIKYVKYQVTSEDTILNALASGTSIDFGMPNCTPYNINKVSELNARNNKFGSQSYWNDGYGYVGVNPKFVPDVEVRQAIMKAMDQQEIIRYYTTDNAIPVYRPTSTNSFVYKKGGGDNWTRWEDIQLDGNGEEIRALCKKAGWSLTKMGNKELFTKDGKTLSFTFTIAGSTADHPAYDMFTKAANILNKNGFDITVTTDIGALQKLATGNLQVWAAAWSSGVDPDMYQVWHKDSTATSVKNWGYDVILNDTTGTYDYEKEIIAGTATNPLCLSYLIEKGRSTTNEDERTGFYVQAYEYVMKLAVEMPTYQRKDLAVYNKELIDINTLNTNASAFAGVLNRIWEVDYN